MNSDDHSDLLFLARLAEKAERYIDMLDVLKNIAVLNKGLDDEERILFSTAVKNSIAPNRHSWRILKVSESHEEKPARVQNIKNYRQTVAVEIERICSDTINLINNDLLPCSTTSDSKVFYLKMKGDYYRYLAEITQEAEQMSHSENAAIAYKEASDIALSELSPTDPLRLGLALNFSVYLHDIMKMVDQASRLAKCALEDAVAELDTLNGNTYRDATLVMQLLRDNISAWSSEGTAENEGGQMQEEIVTEYDLHN